MVQIKVETTVEVPDDFIVDSIIDPAGYGIGYWAHSAHIDSVARTYTVTEQEPQMGDGIIAIDFDTLAQVLVDIAYSPRYAKWEDWSEWAREAIAELQAGEEFPGGSIDSDLGDAIVQFAAFGSLVYG